MFADDVGLLPAHMFTRMLRQARRTPEQFTELAAELFRVMAAGVCGLPAPMVPGSNAAGPAWRESFRQFVALSVQPLGRILEAEVSRVLEAPVTMTHHTLAAADVASKARAYKALNRERRRQGPRA